MDVISSYILFSRTNLLRNVIRFGMFWNLVTKQLQLSITLLNSHAWHILDDVPKYLVLTIIRFVFRVRMTRVTRNLVPSASKPQRVWREVYKTSWGMGLVPHSQSTGTLNHDNQRVVSGFLWIMTNLTWLRTGETGHRCC